MKPIVHFEPGRVAPALLREFLEIELADELHVWIDVLDPPPPHGRHLFVALEPDPVLGLRDAIRRSHARYEHVLTFDDDLLRTLPNAVQMDYGTTWVTDYHFPEKSFGVSMVYGYKLWTEGHHLRRDLWQRRSQLRVPKRFYLSAWGGWSKRWLLTMVLGRLSGYPILGDSKTPLFDTQFHIAIENCRIANYFSEKLIDCLVTRTVPIYWGCPNIGGTFNVDGIIHVQTVDELIERVNRLDRDDYQRRRSAIEDNYMRAQAWCSYSRRLTQKLSELGYR